MEFTQMQPTINVFLVAHGMHHGTLYYGRRKFAVMKQKRIDDQFTYKHNRVSNVIKHILRHMRSISNQICSVSPYISYVFNFSMHTIYLNWTTYRHVLINHFRATQISDYNNNGMKLTSITDKKNCLGIFS